jgi:hypothetical protein
MARFRKAEGPEPINPPELTNVGAEAWTTADNTRVWLERHGLVRRLRPLGVLAELNTPQERRAYALALWKASRPNHDAWMVHVRIDGESDNDYRKRMDSYG